MDIVWNILTLEDKSEGIIVIKVNTRTGAHFTSTSNE